MWKHRTPPGWILSQLRISRMPPCGLLSQNWKQMTPAQIPKPMMTPQKLPTTPPPAGVPLPAFWHPKSCGSPAIPPERLLRSAKHPPKGCRTVFFHIVFFFIDTIRSQICSEQNYCSTFFQILQVLFSQFPNFSEKAKTAAKRAEISPCPSRFQKRIYRFAFYTLATPVSLAASATALATAAATPSSSGLGMM